MPIAATRGGANGDEHRLSAGDARREVIAERQPPGRDVARHQAVEPRLVDRHPPFAQGRELRTIGLHNRYLDAEFGEAGGRDQPDIAAADHCDAQNPGLRKRAAEMQHKAKRRASTAVIHSREKLSRGLYRRQRGLYRRGFGPIRLIPRTLPTHPNSETK